MCNYPFLVYWLSPECRILSNLHTHTPFKLGEKTEVKGVCHFPFSSPPPPRLCLTCLLYSVVSTNESYFAQVLLSFC